MTVKAGFKH